MSEAFTNPANAFPFRIAVRAPDLRNIPVFALNAERERAASELVVLLGDETLDELLSKEIALSLCSGYFGEYQVFTERKRLTARTVAYTTWLAFSESEGKAAFLRAFPQFGP